MLEAAIAIIVQYFKDYIIFLVLLIGLTLLMRHNELIGNVNVKKLWYAIWLTTLLTVVNNIQLYCAELETYTYTRTVTSYLSYAFSPIVIISVIDLITNGNKKLRIFMLALSIINIIAFLPMLFQNTSLPFAHAVVWFDEDNIFQVGGILRYSCAIVQAIFDIILLITSFTRFKKRRNEALVVIFVFVATMTAGIMEMAADSSDAYATGLLNTVIMACLVIYYTFLHINITKVDPVTNLYNRASFFADTVQYNSQITAVVSLDMNGLKAINDNQGHKEGDIALAAIADAFEQGIKKYPRATAYRTGGDEFMMLFYGEKEELIQMIKVVKAFVDDTEYTCSIGWAYRDANQSIDELEKIADQLMYEDKAKFYQLTGKDRRK